jgi:hypothetical protein
VDGLIGKLSFCNNLQKAFVDGFIRKLSFWRNDLPRLLLFLLLLLLLLLFQEELLGLWPFLGLLVFVPRLRRVYCPMSTIPQLDIQGSESLAHVSLQRLLKQRVN